MKEWKQDSGSSEDIIRHIREIGLNYTPEWNFNPENPDIGAALAFVYAEMQEETMKQLNRAGYKNQLAFFNALGAGLERALPARGYAAFRIAADAPEGAEIDAGTGMAADIPDAEESTAQYETTEDIYVTPARPQCLYFADGQRDGIYRISDNVQEQKEALVLFREKGENLQTHELYMAHEEVLDIFGEAYLEINFYTRNGQPLEKEQLNRLTDPGNAVFSYWSENGWQNFSDISFLQDSILLHKLREQAPFAKRQFDDMENYMVRCRILDIGQIKETSIEKIGMCSRSLRLAPQSIYGASVECNPREYFPFGQRMMPFEEVYFGSMEALSKKGADISLSFYLDFAVVPLETNPDEKPVEWKWVMKKSDFRPDPDYDISIEEVIWEYFNGNGWSRLFPGQEYSDVFSIHHGLLSQQKTISFTCPEDMMPILVNSCETCYIRARILKMNNLYKLKGQYIVPVLGNTTFSYSYREKNISPQWVGLVNNLETRVLSGREMEKQAIPLFQKAEVKEKTLYLGFDRAPKGSPVRMLFLMEDALPEQSGSLCWEYYSTKGWREMNLADETRSLTHSGLVTFIGQEDFCKVSRFGRCMYWIRLRDENGFYEKNAGNLHYPVLKAVWMNAVEIRHMERKETELFTLDETQENCSFQLMHGNIDEISVSICEDSGENADYVLWKETKDLETEEPDSWVYRVDRETGTVFFGNGSHGRIPPLGREDGIKISYKCGGGSRANAGPGQVNKLNQTIGFVTGVHNPESLWGGMDAETPAEALHRYGAKLRHWNRAVTVRDYEELAREASRVLNKVRCFGGRNRDGEKEAGAVTLVVLPGGDYMDKSLTTSVQETVYQYLQQRMDPSIVKRKQFYVTGPKLVEVKVMVEVVVESFQEVFQVRRKIQERIQTFLDPMKGHFDGKGWNIGQFPGAMQIQNAMKEIPEILQIRKVYLVTFVSGPKGRQEVDPETIRMHPYILPVSGTHEVLVTVQGN